jgi:hypothetical protein
MHSRESTMTEPSADDLCRGVQAERVWQSIVFGMAHGYRIRLSHELSPAQDCGDLKTISDLSRAGPNRSLLRVASPHASN